NASTRGDVGISFPRTQLRTTGSLVGTVGRRASGVNSSAASVEQRQRIAALNQNVSGSHPSLNEFPHHAAGPERQFVLIANDEPMRPAVGRLSILLVHIVRVVQVP